MVNALEQLGHVAATHATQAEAATPGFTNFTPLLGAEDGEDVPDISGLDPARESILGATFAIEYRDSKGAASRRRITALRFSEGTLVARCHERRALRTFRLDRITCVVDRNGVIYDTGDFFDMIQFPIPDFQGDLVYMPGLQMLSAVAFADGWMTADETERMAQYCVHLCDDHNIHVGKRQERQLLDNIAALYPSKVAVNASMNRLKDMTARDRRLIYRYAVEVMDADGEHHPAEFAAVAALRAEMD